MTVWTIAGLLSLCSIGHLWLRQSGKTLVKCLWTVPLLIPYLGPLFYFAMYEPPEPQELELRARLSDRLQGVYGNRKHLDHSDR